MPHPDDLHPDAPHPPVGEPLAGSRASTANQSDEPNTNVEARFIAPVSSWPVSTVANLQQRGALLVEDGNHGEVRPRQEEFGTTGVPFIRAADMDNGQILFDSASRINNQALKRIRKGMGKPGDVLISHKGTVGKVAFAPLDCEPFVCSPQTTFWRVTDESQIDRGYLFAYLRSQDFQNQLRSRKSETDMADYVSLTAQRMLTVPLPPLPEQRAIAAVLGALDDKIELNRKTNQTLEALARAIFQSWFVDFDPVHANAAGRTPPGMDPATAALFPATFQDSPLGPIPVGWSVHGLDEVATYLNGLALQKFPPNGEADLPVIKIAQLRQGDALGADLANGDVPQEYVVNDGDVLFSWSGSLLVDVWSGGTGALNQHLFKVSSDKVPKWFYYHWTKHHLPDFQATASGKATTMGHIQRRHLRDAKLLLPSPPLLSAMSAVLDPLMERSLASRLESRTIAATRDYILPKLLSGQVRVTGEAHV